jgi:hypothetical protein
MSRWSAAAPVVPAAGEQAIDVAFAAHLQPISVVLGPAGGFAARVGMQGATKPEVEETEGIPFEYRLALPAGSPQNAAVERSGAAYLGPSLPWE